MGTSLGFDTSCYTTSAAAVNEHGEVVAASRMLLPVKQGERGLRQSEAVFAHVRQMPLVMDELKKQLNEEDNVKAVLIINTVFGEKKFYFSEIHSVLLDMGDGSAKDITNDILRK